MSKNEVSKPLAVLISLKKEDDIVCPPFALMFISSALKKNGYRVKVVHSSLEEAEARLPELLQEKPLFIGFSLFTGIYCKYSAILSKKIRQIDTSIPIVWGGVHPSLLTEQCLKENYIDIVVMREGEDTIVELANALKDSTPLQNVVGIGYKEQGSIVINKNRPFINNLNLYMPDWDCINVEDYIFEDEIDVYGETLTFKSIGYYSSRGCPFNCSFCYNLAYNDRKWRGTPAEAVIEDINNLVKKYGINKILFWDDLFFTNRKRSFDILEGINIHSDSEVRLDFVTEENANEFKKHKVVYFLVGAESGSDRLLKLINKGFDTKFMIEKVKILSKYDLYTQYSFIIGLPTETMEETYQTIDFMHKIYKLHPKASFTVGAYMPYPGTPLFNIAVREGFIPPVCTEDWETVDRWRNLVKLPWIDMTLCLHVRLIFSLLTQNATSPLFKKWLEYRIKKKWLRLSWDLKAMIFINNEIKAKKHKFTSISENTRLVLKIITRLLNKFRLSLESNYTSQVNET